MARLDFGLTTTEFGRTTPGMFLALMKRKAVEFKHDCYVAGITASMVMNSVRRQDTDKVWTPFDFVPDSKHDEKREQLKQNIFSLFAMLPEYAITKSTEEIEELRTKTIERLTKAGYQDVEAVFDEVFRGWKKES